MNTFWTLSKKFLRGTVTTLNDSFERLDVKLPKQTGIDVSNFEDLVDMP